MSWAEAFVKAVEYAHGDAEAARRVLAEPLPFDRIDQEPPAPDDTWASDREADEAADREWERRWPA